MTLKINTNVAALTAHQNMLKTDSEMNTSLERLSTGLRINRAADDASGMTIADSLKAQYLGIGQGIENANEGVSIVQIADGALEESINIVNTIKTKATQAASDAQTADTRAAIQADIDKLLEELDTIAKTTSYNGQQLLNGGFTNKELQVGSSANQTASISIGATESSQVGHISTATLALADEEGGEVQLNITSAIDGTVVELESVEILMNNQEENGMGALADEINTQTYLTGISATAVVESTTEVAIQEGSTGSDFKINGISVGAVNVSANDSDAALVTAINDRTTETGVSAAIEADGTLTLTSEDGRAIYLTGSTGGVFGDQTAEDLSTIGYITLTQEGSSQFNIEGVTFSGTGDEITLTADLTTTDEATLGTESTIVAGSLLAAGSQVGGDAMVNSTVTETLAGYTLADGSALAAGTTLAQGTVVEGEVTVAGNIKADGQDTVALNQDTLITAGSTLAAGTVLGAGTVITTTFTNSGVTYTAGDTLTTDVTLASSLAVTKAMILSDDSELAAGSTLAAGSEIGADTLIGVTYDSSVAETTDLATGTLTGDYVISSGAVSVSSSTVLGAESVLMSGSTVTIASGTYTGPTLVTSTGTIETGDVFSGEMLFTIDGDQVLSSDLTLVSGSLQTGSILASGTSLQTAITSGYWDDATLSNATMEDEMTLNAGSNLAYGSVMATGSILGNDTYVAAEGGGNLETEEESILAASSTLKAGSILAEDSVVGGTLTVDTVSEMESAMTLAAGSTLAADSILKAGTTITEDMVLNTASGGGSTTEVEVTAGTVLTQDLYLDADTTLSEALTLEEGSTIEAGSQIIIETANTGDVTLSDQESLTLADISVMTQEDAQIAISIAEAALADLDATRSDLGSVQNQLESTISNLSVTKTNVQSAESTIRDVDFAEETANFTRLQLLAQTSSYALSQANSSSQNVLSLLQ